MPAPVIEIVYSNAWLNQSSAVAPTTLFTAQVQGLFRVTLAISAHGDAGASPVATVTLSFTDSSGVAQSISASAHPGGGVAASGSASGTGILVGSTTVSGAISVSGFSGTPNFNIVAVIEQLY